MKDLVWLVDDDRSIRFVLERALEHAGLATRSFDNAASVLTALEQEGGQGTSAPKAIVSDIRMPGMDGLALLERIHKLRPELPVIIMTAYADLDRAVAAFQSGAFEYLPKPFDVDDAVSLVRRAVQRADQPAARAAAPASPTPEIVGSAPAMQELFRAIGRLSRSHMTVLLTGESGTGKELVAHALHRHSPRAQQPFIAINTAAIPHDLLESELFGHERGAFTGATAQRIGRFEQADGGTLFLDEIGDMPADLQTRLLRVLADKEFYRVGGRYPTRVDVRVIAATHQDLEGSVQRGQFREDLFHRLNVIRLKIPPLRERVEDIQLLAEYFLHAAGEEMAVEIKTLSREALAAFLRYAWPGNVRELENVCHRLTVMAAAREIREEDLPVEIRGCDLGAFETDALQWEKALRQWAELQLRRGGQGVLERAVPAFERVLIAVALERTGGRRQDAARLLGWGRNTLTRKIRELHMEV
jgi:two-component system nitrogen regulation response regulator GlnG